MLTTNRKIFARVILAFALQTLVVFSWLQFNHGHSAHEYLMAQLGEDYAITHNPGCEDGSGGGNRFTGFDYRLLSPVSCVFLNFYSQNFNWDETCTVEFTEKYSEITPSKYDSPNLNCENFHFYLRAPPLSETTA